MSNKPIATIRSVGAPGLSAPIWGSKTEGHFNVKIEKSYKDKAGDWQKTEYLSPQDMAGLAILSHKVIETCDRLKALGKRNSVPNQIGSPEQASIDERFGLPPAGHPASKTPGSFDDDDIPF